MCVAFVSNPALCECLTDPGLLSEHFIYAALIHGEHRNQTPELQQIQPTRRVLIIPVTASTTNHGVTLVVFVSSHLKNRFQTRTKIPSAQSSVFLMLCERCS
uniref:Uncharacterized protein n=1 Tax=Nothobranchius kuhntae TaxID=321403 RepID=A0A1A8IQV3_NOTKU